MIEKTIWWDYQRVGEHCELGQFGLGKVVGHQLEVRMS